MISVHQAIQQIREQNFASKKKQTLRVEDALGFILATHIDAPINLPPFKQSNMDGYAVRFRESENTATSYNLIGEIKAGDAINLKMKPGDAVRIFTGAMIPDNADAVVMQEKSIVKNTELIIDFAPLVGQHMRAIGSQISKGSNALPKGHYMTPVSIGLLKSLGIEKVQVYETPKVTIIVTGNELVTTGNSLKEGQIYESNSEVLKAALHQQGIQRVSVHYAKDTLKDTETIIHDALIASDIVLISGGISVGDYDFVGTALQNLDVKQLFYKVLQKPGKPLFFGKKDTTYVFALPGNPASTLTCFYVYVIEFIDRFVGNSHSGLMRVQLPISEPFENRFNKTLFLKARVHKNSVEILDHQSSSTVISFAAANALVCIPEEIKKVDKGNLVETLILPYGSSN
ncbi:molybdopterin molybdenumtransferase MoeA [Dokdonia pacifica]|uniref:Molybdopterin molybdenumtransferase n=1 Tax=Dokdonia pacifica TaxID=1627892 RepID=A0A238YZA6_9FLAO|nr:gephyrin-like molybdotransferase Glp [Dokdonia pacifica]GGG09475.1 molybdopterin molybdenumtransferase MoeA [Dokdonia pacifica]SNR75879.1 molybdopterin molybdochelatase [Dokdonia pacifica]